MPFLLQLASLLHPSKDCCCCRWLQRECCFLHELLTGNLILELNWDLDVDQSWHQNLWNQFKKEDNLIKPDLEIRTIHKKPPKSVKRDQNPISFTKPDLGYRNWEQNVYFKCICWSNQIWFSGLSQKHTPNGTPTLEVGVLVNSWMFREQLQGSKPNGLRSSLYHLKDIETQMSKMSLHDPFGHLKHKLWPKERLGVKLVVWFLTIKSRESTRFTCVQVACNISLESSWRGYNFASNLISIRVLHTKLWAPKVVGVPTLAISGLPLGSPGTKCHLDVGFMERHIIYYKGEGGGFPQVQAVLSFASSNYLWFVLAPKVLQLCTNHLMLVLCRSMWIVEACHFS